MLSMSGSTQALPFSTGMKRSRGNRVARPCPMIEEMVSLIDRYSLCTSW